MPAEAPIMSDPPPEAGSPVTSTERITNLDAIRGVATLGILVMNAVSYGLPEAAYFNLRAGGTRNWFDASIGVLGEIFVDQKTMALFSLLFGAGIVMFAGRAEQKGRRPIALSTWRNLLLLAIGLIHAMLWEGDILVVYALCSPVVLALRHRRPHTLVIVGSALVATSAGWAVVAQTALAPGGAGLGTYWFGDGAVMSDTVGIYLLVDFFARALGMMLIGVALFKMGVVQGDRSVDFYQRMARWGLGVGLPIATAGVLLQASTGFSTEIALAGEAPNTVATIPMALGYLAVVTLWNRRSETGWHQRIRAVGRMALTNYLAHTVIGILLLRVILDRGDLGRGTIAAFVVGVWAVQLIWSKWWLQRFRFGPAEWVWRSLTYRAVQPLRI